MNKKIKLRGALKSYLLWPILLTVVLLCMNLSIYIVDKKAGLLLSGVILVYFLIAVTIYYLKRNKIASELIHYAMDYGQVQKRLLKELALPYAILDIDGKLQWGNDEFLDIVNEKKTTRRYIFSIFKEITVEKLPKTEKDESLHVRYNERSYRILLRKIKAPNFDNDTEWHFEGAEDGWDDKNSIIAMFMYDETEIITLQQ